MKSPCIIVNRVSSAEQKDGYSLDAQSRMGRQYATDNKLEIIHEFTFQESASKMSEQRQFDEVLTFIKAYCIKQKQTLNIIVEKKDRWGRLHSRKEFIQKLVLDGQVIVHYYRERQVFDKKCSPEDIFMDDVVTSMNKYVAMNIGREAKKGMLEKARQGWLPHKPPPGYVNNPDRNSLIAIVPNENERQWIQRMFELRGKHGFSYDAITKKLIEEGLVPKNRLSVFRKSYTERILKNPFYCGRFIFAGQEYEGKHEIIVSPTLYQAVLRSFQENGKFLNLREGAVFADYFKCGDPACGCKITYHQKKKPSGRIYHFYTCANGRKVHPSLKGRYLTEAEIFEGLEPALDAISITDDMALDVAGALNANHRALQQRLACEVNAYKSSLKAGEGREDELYGDLKRGILTEEMYQRQISAVRSERARLTDLIITLQSSVTDTYLHTAQEILELARDAKTLWKSRPREERAEFLKKILWNPRITGRTIEYELKKPFNVIAKMAGNDKWGG